MIPLWRPIFCATGAIVVALPVDHCVRLLPRRSVVRWPLLALTSLVGAYLVFAIPVLAGITAAALGTLAVLRETSLVGGAPDTFARPAGRPR